MLNFTAIDKAFYDWVNIFTGQSVIWLNQNSPRPNTSYLTLYKSTLTPIGQDFESAVNLSGEMRIGGIRQLTLQINHYGSNSMGVLEALLLSLRMNQYRDILVAEGITHLDRLAINDLSILLDTEFESRAQMDLLFLIGSESELINTSMIEIVNGTAIYKKGTMTVKEGSYTVDGS